MDPVKYAGVGREENTNDAEQKLMVEKMVEAI